tara:strand:+ start:19 stop:960 length:942 start_codon:yes stop_codon:yes gene_type:complete
MTTTTTTTTRASLSRDVRDRWTAIVKTATVNGLPPAVARAASGALPVGTLALAGTSAKVEKGAGARGILPAVVYLAGAAAHAALCPWATAGCIATCLGHKSGRLAFDSMRAPQAWKTALLLGDRAAFLDLARLDLARLAGAASRQGARAAMRIDGASDTGLAADLRDDARRLGVQLWDYTKSIGRAQIEHARTDTTWHVTLSYPGAASDWAPFASHVESGGSVAVVVDVPRGGPLPTTWRGLPAVDGDLTDLRFTDPAGVVVLLRAKGSKRNARNARKMKFSAPAPSPGSWGETAYPAAMVRKIVADIAAGRI